jgi:hypothetical protein
MQYYLVELTRRERVNEFECVEEYKHVLFDEFDAAADYAENYEETARSCECGCNSGEQFSFSARVLPCCSITSHNAIL